VTLKGLHLLLTYQCNHECDHCFLWGSPWQSGTLTLGGIREILRQAGELGTVEWIYFEGGEPFLYYPILVTGVELAAAAGFKVGMVSNAYWATEREDALAWLRPFAGRVRDLSVSSDLYHWSEEISRQSRLATEAAGELGIPVGTISIAQPEQAAEVGTGKLPEGLSGVMYRGRAAVELAGRAAKQPWRGFTECPHEDLREPGRLHLDALGYAHLCQGIVLGNVFQSTLKEICMAYDPESHEVIGPLLTGGPAELARRGNHEPAEGYADACHLCYETRLALRARHPEILVPDQAYGVPED